MWVQTRTTPVPRDSGWSRYAIGPDLGKRIEVVRSRLQQVPPECVAHISKESFQTLVRGELLSVLENAREKLDKYTDKYGPYLAVLRWLDPRRRDEAEEKKQVSAVRQWLFRGAAPEEEGALRTQGTRTVEWRGGESGMSHGPKE